MISPLSAARQTRALLACALLCMASAVHAQQAIELATGVMRVTLDLIDSCSVSASDLSFGRVQSPSPSSQLGETSLQVRCTRGLGAEVAIEVGLGPGATMQERKMQSGSNVLIYNLYRDSSRSLIWGYAPGINTLSIVGTGVPETIPVYGAIPPGQVVPAGEYGDIVIVRVFF